MTKKPVINGYAGDEFVVILNIKEKSKANEYVESVHKAFENYNKTSGKQYNLSVAIGCDNVNLKEKNAEDILNHAGKMMYAKKAEYYVLHPKQN